MGLQRRLRAEGEKENRETEVGLELQKHRVLEVRDGRAREDAVVDILGWLRSFKQIRF